MGRLDQVAVIISAEDTDKGKPDPEGYRLALAGLRTHIGNSHGELHQIASQPTNSSRQRIAWWSKIALRELFRRKGPACERSACPTPTPPINFAMPVPTKSSMSLARLHARVDQTAI